MGTVRLTEQAVEVLFADAFSTPPRQWEETAGNALPLFQDAGHAPARRYERFANGGTSSLDGAIDDDDLFVTVKSAVGFPTIGNFRIIIESEILLVTNVQGNTFWVERGIEDTAAASHDDGTAVFHVLTAGALAARDTDQCVTGTPANQDVPGQAGRLYIPNHGFVKLDTGTSWDMLPYTYMTPPVIGEFTWVNQGTATVADSGGMAVLTPPSVSSGDGLRLLVKSTPTPPYKITMAFIGQTPPTPTGGSQGAEGICWRDSTSGKIIGYGYTYYSNLYRLQKTFWNSPTSLDTQSVFYRSPPVSWPKWLRLVDDGTNRWAETSGDGFTWQAIEDPESRDTFITPDQVGFFANNSLNSHDVKRIISFLHWSES